MEGIEAPAYILLDVFLAVLERGLAKLRSNLRCGIVHELAIGTKDIASIASLLLVRVAAVSLLRLRGARRRRRRPQLRNCRNVLRHRVVQRGRLPVICSLHGRCGCRRVAGEGIDSQERRRKVVRVGIRMVVAVPMLEGPDG